MKKIWEKSGGIYIPLSLVLLGFSFGIDSLAEDRKGKKTQNAPKKAKRINVDQLKKQYWDQEDTFDVVQNRLYSKSKKIELGLYGGFTSSDPFVDIKLTGLSLGYHFNEYVSAHLLAWKFFSKSSTALETLESQIGASAGTNFPKSFIGAEGSLSIIYGKLSLLGEAIVYYDFHLLGGAGRTSTESGDYLTGIVGLGQQFYISQLLSFRVDYRLSYYRETILEKVLSQNFGQPISERANWGSNITLGLSFLLF